MCLNGALAGLVAITAGCNVVDPLSAIVIGIFAGVLVDLGVIYLNKYEIDDVVGAVPVHLGAGVWGTISVGLFSDLEKLGIQRVYKLAVSAILWYVMKMTIGIRVTPEAEIMGLDRSELGMDAYPEFTKN